MPMNDVALEIAATAARLVVEEGLAFGPAKHRALKALGLPGRTALPSNEVVEAEVRDDIAFLKGFLQHPDQVGSVIPSSGFLEQRLIRSAALAQARCVVELGPGTGGTTRADSME